MQFRFFKYIFSILILFFSLSSQSQAQEKERILNFKTLVQVNANRSIDVQEEIIVYAAGGEIKRGITRSLPIKGAIQNGQYREIRYQDIQVWKDGKKESFHTKTINNHKIVYIGNKDIFLRPGNYHYTIKYHVPEQIKQADHFDEIYWNAIGPDVIFPIEQASCLVSLPTGGKSIQESCYTGKYGVAASDCTSKIVNQGNEIFFQSTHPLKPREGFTVAVGFEKGLINPPSFFEKFGVTVLLFLVTIGMAIYFFLTWNRHGIDPPKPTPYPLFAAPNGYSPAAISYISKEKYKSNKITASIILLAIKGYLKIEEEDKRSFLIKKKHYHLSKTNKAYQDLYPEDKALMQGLFAYNNKVTIDGTHDPNIEKGYTNHRSSIRAQYEDFINIGNNRKFLIAPIITSIFAVVAAFSLIFSLIGSSWNIIALVIFIPLAILSIVLYAYLIKRPTEEKLKLQSEIEGFKMYLEMAEKDRLNLLNPPDRTPEHFESMLPYAFALGVEHKWSEIFKTILEQAAYRPEWANTNTIYTGHYFSSGFSNSIISSATPPPPESSGGFGSGGGGFSGGGGGGGGVGGW